MTDYFYGEELERAGTPERVAFPYRLAAFDLDGTLMRYDGEITADTLSALEALRGLGVRVVLATGRRYEGAREHALRLGFGEEEPLVCFGGAMIRTVSGRTHLRHTMPAHHAVEVLRWAEGNGIRSRVLGDGWLVSSGDPVETVRDAGPAGLVGRDEMQVVGSTSRWLRESGEDPIKVTLVSPPEEVERWLGPLQDAFSERLFITRSFPHFVEVGGLAGIKSRALAALCEAWGIGAHEVVAFGDGENDIDMLRFAGRGVAVGGITPAVREAADDVTHDVYGEGVARYVERLISGEV